MLSIKKERIVEGNVEEIGDYLIAITGKGPFGWKNLVTTPDGDWSSTIKTPEEYVKEDILGKFSEEFKTKLKKYIVEEYSPSKRAKILLEIIGD